MVAKASAVPVTSVTPLATPTTAPAPTSVAAAAPSSAPAVTVPLGKSAGSDKADKRAGNKAPPEPEITAVKPLAAAASPSTKAGNTRSPEPVDKAPVASAAKPAKPEAPAKAATAASANVSVPANGASEPAKPASSAAATKPPQFLVNVGLFADANNARNAYTKLMDASLPATSVEFNTSKGKRTRVRVGPFETQAEADRAMEKVRGLGLEAEPVRQP